MTGMDGSNGPSFTAGRGIAARGWTTWSPTPGRGGPMSSWSSRSSTPDGSWPPASVCRSWYMAGVSHCRSGSKNPLPRRCGTCTNVMGPNRCRPDCRPSLVRRWSVDATGRRPHDSRMFRGRAAANCFRRGRTWPAPSEAATWPSITGAPARPGRRSSRGGPPLSCHKERMSSPTPPCRARTLSPRRSSISHSANGHSLDVLFVDQNPSPTVPGRRRHEAGSSAGDGRVHRSITSRSAAGGMLWA